MQQKTTSFGCGPCMASWPCEKEFRRIKVRTLTRHGSIVDEEGATRVSKKPEKVANDDEPSIARPKGAKKRIVLSVGNLGGMSAVTRKRNATVRGRFRYTWIQYFHICQPRASTINHQSPHQDHYRRQDVWRMHNRSFIDTTYQVFFIHRLYHPASPSLLSTDNTPQPSSPGIWMDCPLIYMMV